MKQKSSLPMDPTVNIQETIGSSVVMNRDSLNNVKINPTGYNPEILEDSVKQPENNNNNQAETTSSKKKKKKKKKNKSGNPENNNNNPENNQTTSPNTILSTGTSVQS